MSEFTGQHVAWRLENEVGYLTLNRPPLNVLNIAMLRELSAALEVAAGASAQKALVVRAEGKMFSAGVDVADHTAERVPEMIPLFDCTCAALAEFPAPTLAVVHGHALGGGCELALCCDFVIAAESANLGQPEIKLATIAPIAALRLPRLVGYRRAVELMFTGETLGAAEAARIGLVNRAVPPGELGREVEALLGRLRGLSAAALRLCKRAVRLGADGWAKLAEMEILYLDELMATHDAHEGVAAFIEKRAPVWRDE